MLLNFIGRNELDLNSWEEIIFSLITYSDKIYIPSHLRFSNELEENVRKHFNNTLIELIENKTIKTWEFEFNSNKKYLSGIEADIQISLEEYNNLNNKIDKLFIKAQHKNRVSTIGNGIERTSKLIEYRNDLWNILIGDMCGSNGFISRRNQSFNFLTDKSSEYSELYFTKLFKRFEISNLWTLDAEQIIHLQKKVEKPRNSLNKLLNKKLMHVDSLETVFSEDIDKLYLEYKIDIDEIIELNLGKRKYETIITHLITKVAGIGIPFLPYLPIIGEIIYEVIEMKKNAFLIYITELKKIDKND